MLSNSMVPKHGVLHTARCKKMPSRMDVAPWSYKWMGWVMVSAGGMRYKATFGSSHLLQL